MQTLVCNQCSLYSVRTFGWPPYSVELQTAEPGIELHISGKVRRLQMAKAEVWLQSFKWPFNPSLLSVTVSTVILSYVSQIKRNCAISYLHPSSFLTLDVVGKMSKLSQLLHWLLLWDNRLRWSIGLLGEYALGPVKVANMGMETHCTARPLSHSYTRQMHITKKKE